MTLFQEIIPCIHSEISLVFEDNENIKATFMYKKKNPSLVLSSTPVFWISSACAARHAEKQLLRVQGSFKHVQQVHYDTVVRPSAL